MQDNLKKEALKKHYEWKGKIEIKPRVDVFSKESLSMAYTPGVAEACMKIHENKDESFNLTRRWNVVPVITDGTAVLGLGDIGPEAGMPVMEGKCALFKAYGDVDAIPLCIRSKDSEEIIKTIELLAGSFGGINLEDIAAPRCFEIEKRLKEDLDIRFVVPGKTLGEVLKLLPEEDDKKLSIFAGQRHIMFDTGDYCIISRLLDGEFLDYEVSIPDSFKTRLCVSTRAMLESVERVSLLISERFKSPVKSSISAGFARLSCSTAIGKAYDEFPISIKGEDIEVGFNSKYMIDALKNTDTDEVVIELNGPLSPIKILPKEGNSFLFLVLPVRLRA